MAKKSASKTSGVKFRKLEKVGIIKWEKGMYVEGVLADVREGTSDLFAAKGHLADIKTADGLQTYSCPTILHNYLKQCEKGDTIRITCLGKIKAKRGRAWDFEVAIAVNEDDDNTNDAE